MAFSLLGNAETGKIDLHSIASTDSNGRAEQPISDAFSVADKAISQPRYGKQSDWIDSVYAALTPSQRIGQLFMVAAFSGGKDRNDSLIARLVREHAIGGLIFFKGTPYEQSKLTNYFQQMAPLPLLIGMDAEWGLAMRLDSVMKWPNQMTLGACYNDELVYKMGNYIAQELKRMGVHISFSPCVDVNNNPANPVINFRSFGQDPIAVTDKAFQYMRALQENNILACAKHFPGHGDTDADSHHSLPLVNATRERLDSVELYPYKKLIKAGLGSVMAAHLQVPALDTAENKASSLSEFVVKDLLRKELKFKGLVFTDALNMKGVSKYFKPGELEILALKAGNDVLLYSEDIPTAVAAIQTALDSGILEWDDIAEKVKRILAVKEWAGLKSYSPIANTDITQSLNQPAPDALCRTIYEKASTLLNNQNHLLPIQNLGSSTLLVTVGTPSKNEFKNQVALYQRVQTIQIGTKNDSLNANEVRALAAQFDIVLVAIHLESQKSSRNFGLETEVIQLIQQLGAYEHSIVVVFGNPYSLKLFENAGTLVCAYEDNIRSQKATAQAIYGAIPFSGQLPVTINAKFNISYGLSTYSLDRLSYPTPEQIGLKSDWFTPIDSIVNLALTKEAFPGCQIMAIFGNKVVFQKNYGQLQYAPGNKTNDLTLYDIASITKVASTANALMKLKDEHLFNPDTTVAYYLPELKETEKGKIYLREIMTHQAGFPPFIPFWKSTLENDTLSTTWYCTKEESSFTSQVADSLWVDSVWKQNIWNQILACNLGARGKYVYSDLGYYILQRIVEKQTGLPIDKYMEEHFWCPMGLATTTYRPSKRFLTTQIAPTELDQTFRFRQIQGTVHDQGAALMGGVAGHAGVFSNANDLGKIGYMWLNKGVFDGRRFLSDSVIQQFSARRFSTSRRGLCFDKPETEKPESPTSKSASSLTFGHTGFTGTCIWVDPKSQIVFVFLSNRIFPSVDNKLLIQLNVRTAIQEVLYDIKKKQANVALQLRLNTQPEGIKHLD